MKYRIYAAPVFCVLILSACGENEAGGIRRTAAKPLSLPAVSTPAKSNTPTISVPANVTNTSTGKLNPAHGQPGHRCDIAVGAPLPETITPGVNTTTGSPVLNPLTQTTTLIQPGPATSVATTGLNPAHGQPGHRCDIAVGAPLNTAPAKNQAATKSSPVINPQAQNNTVLQSKPDTLFARGLNPAHGKPGHRCDIAVGAPLNTAPAKNQATTKSSPAINPQPKNNTVIQAKPDTLFAKGLNPAHGQYGHRCDIAVGQPLSSAPKKN